MGTKLAYEIQDSSKKRVAGPWRFHVNADKALQMKKDSGIINVKMASVLHEGLCLDEEDHE